MSGEQDVAALGVATRRIQALDAEGEAMKIPASLGA